MAGTKTPQLQPSTVDLYRYLLRRQVPRFGAMAVGRITAIDVQAWLAGLHSTDLSPNTVAKAYRVLRGVMDGAFDAGLIPPLAVHPEGRRDLRHTAATLAAASGTSLKALMARIGHASAAAALPLPARHGRPGRRHRSLPRALRRGPARARPLPTIDTHATFLEGT